MPERLKIVVGLLKSHAGTGDKYSISNEFFHILMEEFIKTFIMKNSYIITLFTILLLHSSCNRPHCILDVYETDFKNQSKQTIHGNKVDVTLPVGISDFVKCDSLFILLSHDPNAQISVYSSNDWQLLGSFCSKGRARNEFLSPSMISKQIFHNENGKIMLPLREYRDEIRVLDITKSLETHNTVISQKKDCSSIYYVFLDNNIDYKFEYIPPKIDHSLQKSVRPPEFLIRRDENQIKKIKVYPRLMSMEDPDYDSDIFYHGVLYKHPHRNLIIQPLISMDYILFFDIDYKKYYLIHQQGSLSFEDHISAIVETDDMTQMYEGKIMTPHFGDVICTDSFFMTLYFSGDYSINVPDINKAAPELLLFNWEGIFLKSVKLDTQVQKIAYDEKHHILYGLEKNNEQLYSFDLSVIL